MTEKEAILRDLKVIAILDDKINYSDHENIGAVLKLNPKSLFSTSYGERYLDRVRKMYNGEEYENTCILCGAPLDGKGPICNNCYKMITIGNAQIPERPQPVTEASKPETEAEKMEPVVKESVTAEPEPAVEEPVAAEPEPAVEESVAAEPETPAAEPEQIAAQEEAQSEPESVTPIVSYDAAKTAEEKNEEGFEDDAKKVQKTYDELEQDVVDPKAKHIYFWRALILLFIVACFSVGIVCGLVLMIRHAGRAPQKYGYGMVTEEQLGSFELPGADIEME
ncbi:MAG: hypothetical protein PUG68_10005 [Lachnospiraceae bacterium]|nr:hypothetical protein [Lachnospiraceae bacterium]MDY2760047.1 hypothetical protein [Lachnospiraceae bacterium]